MEHIERGHKDALGCVVGSKYIWIRRQSRSVGAWGVRERLLALDGWMEVS